MAKKSQKGAASAVPLSDIVSEGFKVLPLGGVGECGALNLMLYICDGDMIAVDVGLTFADESCPGVDVVVPDITYVRQNLDKLKAIFITHAHEDHVGALPYLWEDMPVPVYATKFSKLIVEEKFQGVGLNGKVPVREAKPGKPIKIGPFEVEYIDVTHSIPEANGLAIRTPYGTAFHTGDYKFDASVPVGSSGDENPLKALGDKGVIAMLGDSTSVMQKGTGGEEESVHQRLISLVAGSKERIIFCNIPSNVARLASAMDAAIKNGRKIALFGRTMQKRVENARVCGYLSEEVFKHIIDIDAALTLPAEKAFIMVTGSQAQQRSALTRLAYGELDKFAIQKGDVVIHSALWIPGGEKNIARMVSNLEKRGARVYHMYNERGVYASGHPYEDDVKRMYGLIRPQLAIPVHGDFQQMRIHAELAKSVGVPSQMIIEDGIMVHLAPGKPHIVEGRFPTGRHYVDGLNILDEDRYILKERRQMADAGVAAISLIVDEATRQIQAGPFVRTRGLMDEKLQSDIIRLAQDEARRALWDTYTDGVIPPNSKAEEVMRQAVRRVFNRERGRKPVTMVQVMEV